MFGAQKVTHALDIRAGRISAAYDALKTARFIMTRAPRAGCDSYGRWLARASGDVGVAIATLVGGTNMVTGIATACSILPDVCITVR